MGQTILKPAGRHPEKALSSAHVRNAKKPGRYADGNGLYLVVDPSGAKRWLLRTIVMGKRTDIGLGGLATVSLAEARETAAQMRKQAREGNDPLAARRAAKKAVMTFEEAATATYAAHKESWANEKHANQWINSLKVHAFPVIGRKPVDQIESSHLLAALSPIWQKTPETARRVLQRMRTVMDWAKASGHRKGDNPADGVPKALPKNKEIDQHHKALPYTDVPSFIGSLQRSDATPLVKLAFEFAILTAGRTSEVLEAKWSELDLQARTWTVPATRMKAKREHRVPLTARAVEILEQAKALSGDSEYIFAGTKPGKPLSNMVFLMTLRRMQVDVTAHGFRSSFRDWASEQTNFPNAVCEAALAHTIKNKVEAAYHRTDLFEKRRELMDEWVSFAASGKVNRQ